MKKTFYLIVLVLVFSACKKEGKLNSKQEISSDLFDKEAVVTTVDRIEKGDNLFHGKGNCATCHQLDEKIIGPSIIEIATIYKKNGGDIISFLREKSQPIVDPSQYSLMKSNLIITKKMSDDELQALSDYMMSTIAK